MTRVGHPKGSGYAALHEGFIGVIGEDGAQEVNYDKIEKEPHGVKTFKGLGGWVGFTDKYWGAVVAPDQTAPLEARYSSVGGAVKTYEAETVSEPKTIEPGKSADTLVHVFAGAKEVDILDHYKVDPGLKRFDLLIDWGWFYFITRPMFRAIDFLSRMLGNFGLGVLAVTVLVKLAFLPHRQPQLPVDRQDALDPAQDQSAQGAIRATTSTSSTWSKWSSTSARRSARSAAAFRCCFKSPCSSRSTRCLVVTIEMRQAPFFGWIKDLSAPDPTNVFNLFGLLPYDPTHVAFFGPYLALGVWPLLMGVTMWLQMKMNPEPTDEIQKTMFSWMPVMFTFTMGGFASGLVIYWTWNNSLSILQQWIIMKRAGIKFELWDNLRKTFGLA